MSGLPRNRTLIQVSADENGIYVEVDCYRVSFFNKNVDFIPNTFSLKQIHSNIVATNETFTEGDAILLGPALNKAMIQTADCVPLAILSTERLSEQSDERSLPRAVLAHCGWRGLKSGIVESALEHLNMNHGVAILGPHARSCCYEVQPDFLDNFPNMTCHEKRSDKIFFSLAAIISLKLRVKARILDLGVCTICNNSWRSYRRDRKSINNYTLLEIIN